MSYAPVTNEEVAVGSSARWPLDLALGELLPFGPKMSNGGITHAPMVAEALTAMGRSDAAMPWIDGHRGVMRPWPELSDRLDAERWRSSLGSFDLITDWRDYFAGELKMRPWSEVVGRWSRRMAPGLSGGALHGLIRTGHAVRALAAADTVERRGELAAALATWAGYYGELPATPVGQPARDAESALTALPFLPAELCPHKNSIVATLGQLRHHQPFEAALHLLPVGEPVGAQLRDLADLFARVFVDNVHDRLSAVVFTHAITALAAADHLREHVALDVSLVVNRYAWQAACGLYVAYGQRPPSRSITGDPIPARDLIDGAVEHGDEHLIKLTEACLHLRVRPEVASAVIVKAAAYLEGQTTA